MKYTLLIVGMSLSLLGCNTTGIDAQNPAAMPASNEFQNIIVYSNPSDIHYKYKVLGKVTVPNKFANGVKASPQEIMVELKRQAFLMGANGIVHVTPGLAQTTADALLAQN